ncbi:4407_t:CDS:2 [Acaulospora morrowiae]|uniref:Serine/threonine-protein phosphatase 2A activator n=1 Tax=Acaulospora morrowiae TaxID=94023 RepID=A0A9N9H3L6_9GLOM|nr:4407_t:CDS:2 [Acaulospora morrowiae]
MIPQRQILTKDDLDKFQKSSAYHEIFSFIERLNNSVKGLKLSTECAVSPTLIRILEILDKVDSFCKEIPPVNNEKSRFGNPAFRDFYDRVTNSSTELHETLTLPPSSIQEVSRYFVESWGNRKRIDYGTGHEANFIAWLLCIEKLGLIGPDDYTSVPAGSHGVWGLDDYHFLPFMFGSAQLIGHKYIRPKSIHDKDIVDEFSKEYMYLACIKFINSVKTASLRWNSPMLDDISGEVLAKLPIMQHFMFGSLIRFEGSAGSAADNEDDDHIHIHAFGQEFPDCCGIKIPSAVGASQMNIREGTFKRLPFD